MSVQWTDARRAFALAGLLTWLPRATALEQAYTKAGIVLGVGSLPWPRWFMFEAWQGWLIWSALVAALSVLWFRPSRVAAGVVFVTALLLVYTEGMNEKAYDRLFLFQSIALAFAGAGSASWGNWARSLLTVVYCGIYGSTGLSKLFFEGDWATGAVLDSMFIDVDFGLRPLGILATQSPAVLLVMSWWTVAFEVAFPLFIWWPRARPWLLILGTSLHLGILATMHVNTFSLIALAGYPVLASPGEWTWVRAQGSRYRNTLLAIVCVWALAAASPWLVARVIGPWPGTAWQPPDLQVHDVVHAHLDAALSGGAIEAARAHWGATDRVLGNGGHRITLLAFPDGKGANSQTGAVVLLALGDVWMPDEATVTLCVGGPTGKAWSAETDTRLWIGPVGHVSGSGGSQVWPGLAGVWLTHRGDFLGVGGSANFARRWAALSPVNVMALPGQWGPAQLPPDTIVLTDTGVLRGPTGKRDTAGAISVDQLARIVQGLARVLADESTAQP